MSLSKFFLVLVLTLSLLFAGTAYSFSMKSKFQPVQSFASISTPSAAIPSITASVIAVSSLKSNLLRPIADFFRKIFGKKDKVDITFNQPPVIDSFTANRSTVCADDKENVLQLTTKAHDVEGDPLLYTYTTTAGKIIGELANVTLDLSGVKSETMIIVTVKVDDGWGGVTSKSTEIRVTKPCH